MALTDAPSLMPFSTLIGHAPIVSLLTHAVVRGSVPQSLLFAGPDGVGKHAAAVALAQALNCPNRKDGDGCGRCPTCDRIARGRHSDVTIVTKGDEASIKIKTLRERVLESVGYRPFEAAHRVYIIDPADDLTIEAQDALLKTLEEPPRSATIVLVSAYPDTLLSTIRSRCHRVTFGLLSEADVARVLTDVVKLPAADARKLASASAGSVTHALEERDGHLDDDREAAWTLVASAGRGGIPARLKAAAAFVQHGSKRRDREAVGARLAIVGSLLRDLGVLRSTSDAPLANGDFDGRLRELAPAFDLPRLVTAFAAVREAGVSLDRNASAKIVSDWLSVKI